MGVTAAVVASTLITATAAGVEMNQQRQAQKGAQNAAKDQQDQINQQIADQNKKDQVNLNQKQVQAGTSQKAAIDAIRAAMTANSASGGTILSGPQGALPAPIQGKSLLGV